MNYYTAIYLLIIIGPIYPKTFLVLNGHSYHHNVSKFNYCDKNCNSNNWGLGYEKHNTTTRLIYSMGTFMDSWDKFSWYTGLGGEYYITNFINFGFSMGIMNKNYSKNKEATFIYMFPYFSLYINKSLAINITIIPTSNIIKGLTAGNEWPTTLFFQYKIKIFK